MKTFGEYIRARRRALQKTQTDIATEIGCSQGYISDMERGESNPVERDTIEALAKALLLPPEDLDRLLGYSFFDRDPIELFGQHPSAPSDMSAPSILRDSQTDYVTQKQPIRITVGDSAYTVREVLGEPDIVIGKGQWLYTRLGVSFVFNKDSCVSRIIHPDNSETVAEPAEKVKFTFADFKDMLRYLFDPEAFGEDLLEDQELLVRKYNEFMAKFRNGKQTLLQKT